jgi:hypothetical protein
MSSAGAQKAAVDAAMTGEAPTQEPRQVRQPLLRGQGYKVITPNSAVVVKWLALMPVRFGAATCKQEQEFRLLTQASGQTTEQFANDIQQGQRTLRHRNQITDSVATMQFINGLSERASAEYVRTVMLRLPESQRTVDAALQATVEYEDFTLQELQVNTDKEVACTMLRSSNIPVTPKPESSEKELVKQMMQLGRNLPADHPLAPCRLKGHSGHSNAQCHQQ